MTHTAVTPTRVLVTGANGRLGRRLVGALRAMPAYDVWAGGRSSGAVTANGVRLDLADPDDIRRVVADVDPRVIVHLGAVVGARCDDDPEHAERVNVAGTGALAETLAGHQGARIVFASTAAVYGGDAAGAIPESAASAPSSLYGRQKQRAEELLERVAETSAGALTAVALRIFNVFGPGFDSSLVERLRQSSPALPVELWAIDEFVRDYVHVDDVVDAIVRSMSAELQLPFTAVNIGSGVGISSRQLVSSLSAASPVFYDAKPGRPSSSVANIRRAGELLGFEPRLRLN
jgi:UDP-glucose 4-epimerase